MKKFLSLVLALVMTMSLVTISAGAKDFTDNSKINYDEAVAVISAIGVVDGYTDGAFNPQNTLTRGAAAKIICNLILGPTTASALSADTAPFKDVPVNHEFSGYIAHCAKEGIINGYADGTFRPAGTLTGYAFMKMLLGALGYDSTIQGFTGANWTVSVAKLALGIGLKNGNDDFDGNKAVTREEACLYAFNTLKATMVDYESKITANVNGAEVTIGNSSAEPVKWATGSKNDGNIDKDGFVQFAEQYFEKLSKTNNTTDSFGRPANEWKYKAEIIGTYPDNSNLIATYDKKAPKGELYSLIGSSIISDLANDSKSSDKTEYTLSFYVDGEKKDFKDRGVSGLAAEKGYFFDKNSSAAAGWENAISKGKAIGQSGNGVLTQVFMDDDNNVTITMINTYLVKATADYNASRESVTVEPVDINTDSSPDGITLPNLPTRLDQDDFDVENVKEDDYLLVTYSYMDNDVVDVKPAEKVTETVSQYTVGDSVVMGGETYKYNKLVGATEAEQEFSVNQDATVVLDEYGYILYIDEAISSNSYVYIKEFGSTSGLNSTAVADAYFADGTNAEITIKKVAGVDKKSTIAGYGTSDAYCHWYTYTKDGNGNYTLSNPAGGRSVDSVRNAANGGDGTSNIQIAYNKTVRFLDSSADANIGAKTVKADSKTVFVSYDYNENLSVATGVENAPDVFIKNNTAAGLAKISWVEKNGYATFVFIDVSEAAGSSVDDSNVADYLFVLKQNASNKKTVVDGSEYWLYDVIVDGEQTTRYIDSGMTIATGKLYYNIKTNSDGYINKGTEVQYSAKQTQNKIVLDNDVITKSNNTLDVAGNAYVVTKDTELYLILGKGCALLHDSGASYETYIKTTVNTLAGVVNDYDLTGTAYAVVDEKDSEELEVLYVYVKQADKHDADRAGTPELTADAANVTSYALGETASQLKVTATVAKNLGTLTYTVKNSSGATSASGNYNSATGIQFYPNSTNTAVAPAADTYTVEVKNDKGSGNDATASIEIEVTVGAKAISSITATSTQGSVTSGTALDMSKITVEATYTDGSIAYLTADEYTVDTTVLKYTATNTGTATVTVTAGGKTDTFDITVTERTAVITAAPDAVTLAAGKTVTIPLNVTNDGTIDAAVTVTPTDAGSTHTAVAGDITASVANNVLSIALTADAETGDSYAIAITGKNEGGTNAATGETVTVTVG